MIICPEEYKAFCNIHQLYQDVVDDVFYFQNYYFWHKMYLQIGNRTVVVHYQIQFHYPCKQVLRNKLKLIINI